MLTKLFKRRTSNLLLKSSVILQPTSVTLAMVNGDDRFVKQIPCSPNDFIAALEQLMHETDISGSDCQIVLGHGVYQVAQIEKPVVSESEMAQALHWGAKDLISIASDNLLLDYFEYVSNAKNAKINVVASDKTIISPVTELLHKHEVSIKGISIIDIVIARLIESEQPNILAFHLPGMDVLLAVVKQGNLCFSRHIKGYQNLHQMSELDFQEGALNNFGLEIQRCIDFVVGQLKLESISKVSLFVQNFDAEIMASSLQELFDIPVVLLERDEADGFERYPLNALAFDEMEDMKK